MACPRPIWLAISGGESVDKRGVSTAKNRDSIGHYLAGARLPTPANLRRIADIVGTTVEELTGYPERPERPKHSEQLTPDPKPQHHLTVESHDELVTIELPIAGKMRLKLNKVLDWELVLQIQKMVLEAEYKAKVEVNPDLGKVVGGTDTETNSTNTK